MYVQRWCDRWKGHWIYLRDAETVRNDVLFCMVVRKLFQEAIDYSDKTSSFGEEITPKRSGMLFSFDVRKEISCCNIRKTLVYKWCFYIVYDDNLRIKCVDCHHKRYEKFSFLCLLYIESSWIAAYVDLTRADEDVADMSYHPKR